MKIFYTAKKFGKTALAVIDHANHIISEYASQGYDLTLRQLYYQFVSRDLIANNDKEYKRLGNIISDARRAGLVDWDSIVDRTRYLRKSPAWESPQEIVAACAEQFDIDWWASQSIRPEVWIEKDALIGVLEVACRQWHIPYFSCRGYVSDSEIWAAAQRMAKWIDQGQHPIVLHLGDHDPSGIDMSRDIADRLNLFARNEIDVRRIALTMPQIDEYQPPPNPAKITDARFQSYQETYGDESWELDALNPETIANLITDNVQPLIDRKAWTAADKKRTTGRGQLQQISQLWDKAIKATQ